MNIATLISISSAGMADMPTQGASPAKPGAEVGGGAGSHHLLDGAAAPGKACGSVPGSNLDFPTGNGSDGVEGHATSKSDGVDALRGDDSLRTQSQTRGPEIPVGRYPARPTVGTFPARRAELRQDPMKPAHVTGAPNAGESPKATPGGVYLKTVRGGTVVSVRPFGEGEA